MERYEWCTAGFEIPEGRCPGNCSDCSYLRQMNEKKQYDAIDLQIWDMYSHGVPLSRIEQVHKQKTLIDIVNAIAYFNYIERTNKK